MVNFEAICILLLIINVVLVLDGKFFCKVESHSKYSLFHIVCIYTINETAHVLLFFL